MEALAVNASFWQGKRVLLTGHTGFKGGWLSLWLQKLGATVAGYALPTVEPASLFELARVCEQTESVLSDIRDLESLQRVFRHFRPEMVFHLAAQPLVRRSYCDPVETYQVNVLGTVNLLEAVRHCESCRAVVVVTSDKCYENREWMWGYRENDRLGGQDPYSSSKACSELVTAAFRQSFFETDTARRVAVASARAGNVIGGGDFSTDRLVPDVMKSIRHGLPLNIRNPDAIRPWQHVLEPLSGYLLLAERLWEEPVRYAQGWNFGPTSDDVQPVRWIVERLYALWGRPCTWDQETRPQPNEANWLTLDSAKARSLLRWTPRWTLESALQAVVEWYKAYEAGGDLRDVVLGQIASYETAVCRPRVQ